MTAKTKNQNLLLVFQVVAAYTGWNDSRNSGEKAVVYADGSLIDPKAMKDAANIMDEISVPFKWGQGDFILVDNKTVMHARRPFVGERKIMASLGIHASR